MGFFRRESLHERLAREGGLVEPVGGRPAWGEVGIHGIARVREWDAVVTADAPEADGDRIELTNTADGKGLRVDDMPSFGSIPALERLGEAAGPAYAVHAERLDADLWEIRVAPL